MLVSTPQQRDLLQRLEETVDPVAAPHRWQARMDTVGAALALTGYLAPIGLPLLAVPWAARRLERSRSEKRLRAQIVHARTILSALDTVPSGPAFRLAATPVLAASPDQLAGACAAADRLLVLRASVIAGLASVTPATVKSIVHNGVALAVVAAGESRPAFAVWSTERNPAIDRFFVEACNSVRRRFALLLAIEYWSWNLGSPDSLQVTRA